MRIQSLQPLVEKLVEGGFVIENRPVASRREGRNLVVEIGDTRPLDGEAIVENSAAHYLECLRQDRFSWLLFDGSIVQIYYRLRRNSVVFHRYNYIPAPFSDDLRSALGLELFEWIESASGANPLNSPRRTSIRFEYDPAASSEEHAAAHVHINSPDCRLPMRGPLSVQEFAAFIMRHFYSSAFPADLCGPTAFDFDATITNAQLDHFHLGWRRAV